MSVVSVDECCECLIFRYPVHGGFKGCMVLLLLSVGMPAALLRVSLITTRTAVKCTGQKRMKNAVQLLQPSAKSFVQEVLCK